MYINPYDTTACRPLVKTIAKTLTGIAEENARGQLLTRDNKGQLRYDSQVKLPEGVRVYAGWNGGDQLNHPYPMDREELHTNESFVVIDGRGFASPNNIRANVFTPKNEDTWRFMVVTAGLTRLLQEGDRAPFDALIKPTAKVFANWLSSSINRKFKVPDHLKESVEAICALYCYSMFRSSKLDLTESAREIWAIRLQREFRFASPDYIKIVCEKVTAMTSIADLVKNIKDICDTPTLEGLTSLSLLQAAYTAWDPMAGTYILGASLEHLPTLIAIIYISQQQSYRKMDLSKSVKLLIGRDFETEYVQRIDGLLFK